MTSSVPLRLRRYRQKNQGFNEALGNGIQLTMMRIPAGTFVMGAPEEEEDSPDDERPQHQVSVPEFFMGRYPVTQAQWREVASYEPVEIEKLNPDPSHFKGNNRPVEQVNWDEAQEFCRRLSRHTDRQYRLPSEAEWEYACRAGTTTPFHFGETLDAEIANYCAKEGEESWQKKPVYGAGKEGEYREETTEVGQFPCNNWCLHDMHGNVLEWCEDDWHESYEGAPADGCAWIEEGRTRRLLRGGSWNLYPWSCRSAYRRRSLRGRRSHYLGFRVACASPRAL